MSDVLVPLADLAAQNAPLEAELEATFRRILRSSAFILGAELERFEAEVAAAFGASHAVGVSNGTDALHLSLRALGVGPGDEVIVPTWTFIGSATAVVMCGARPVFADVDEATYLLDPASVRAAVTDRTRALIAVHLYGQVADLGPLQAIADEHDLRIVEDACQAHGARLGERAAGTLGDAGCLSFYPSKNLGALGDAGLVMTADADLAEDLRRYRHHGQLGRNDHPMMGYNNRLDALQAALLRVKLPHLERWNARRRELAAELHERLDGLPLVLPRAAEGRDHVYHLYVVRDQRRADLAEHLAARGVQTGVHYLDPIHRTPAHAGHGTSVPLPVSERIAGEVLSLPMFAEMTKPQVDTLVEAVQSFY